MKNTGVVRKIDELGRIVIPKEIRKNLGIKNGEDVQIFVEDNMIMLKKYERIYSFKDKIKVFVSIISKYSSSVIYVSDKEKIIISSDNNYVNERLDNNILLTMEERKTLESYMLNIGEILLNKYYLVIPIIVDADAIGSLILLSDNKINREDRLILNILLSLIFMEM